MKNLGFKLEMEPEDVYLTCKALGYAGERVEVSNSRHLVLDLAHFKGKVKDP